VPAACVVEAFNEVDDRGACLVESSERGIIGRLTGPLNLTRPVARRHSGIFQALVFCRVKAAQLSGKRWADDT